MLPKYTKASGRHWQRQMSFGNDGSCNPCSVFVDQLAKVNDLSPHIVNGDAGKLTYFILQLKLLGDNCLTVDRRLDFTLELNGKWRQAQQLQVTVNLVMTVSTKMTSRLNEIERRNSKMLMNRVLVQPCSEQEDTQVDTSLDNYHCAHFNTTERQLRGSLHLLEDSSEKSQLLPPPFTFAGLTIEVSRDIFLKLWEQSSSSPIPYLFNSTACSFISLLPAFPTRSPSILPPLSSTRTCTSLSHRHRHTPRPIPP